MDYIAHHGIKGQKWGVRRWQYDDGSLTPAGRKHYGIGDGRRSSQDVIGPYSRNRNKTVGSSDDFTPYAMAAVPIVAIATAALAMNGINRVNASKRLSDAYKNRDIESVDQIPKQKGKKNTTEENLKVVNPDYPDEGTTQNCVLCTAAMIMREKGYDVKANKASKGFFDKNQNKLYGKGGELKSVKVGTGNELSKKLSSEGDGAFGALVISWKMGGGHCIFWKNVNGKTVFYDGQNGKTYTAKELERYSNINEARYSRQDNVEPSEYILAAVRRNAA